jgi:hypothetical protein
MMSDAVDMQTRVEVEDAVVRMFVATDERDWATLQDCFANPFTLDMTSMVGGVPSVLAPAQVASAWAEGFKSLDAVHHQIGNIRTTIKGEAAVVRCHGVAFHHRTAAQGLKSRIFVGTYELKLSKAHGAWQITHLLFKLKFIDGNAKLEEST